jgi:hypothetical protein
MAMPNVTDAVWFKSSYSGGAEQNCVEVVNLGSSGVVVRHSKHPTGFALTFSAGEWDAFVLGVTAGEFASQSTAAGGGQSTGQTGPIRGQTD